MRFVPVIALFGTACGLAAIYGAAPDIITGAGGYAADGAARAYQSTRRFLTPVRTGELRPSDSDAPVFRYAAIQRGSIEQTITVTGALQPVKTIEVGSQLSGQLARVYVDFNDTVSKDQPLALIDPRSFAAKVDEARASLAVANSLVDIAAAKLDRARIDLQNARGNRDVLAAKLESAQAVKASAQEDLAAEAARCSRKTSWRTTTVDEAQTEFAARLAQEREAEVLMSLNAYAVEGAQADVRRIEAELRQARMAVPEKAGRSRGGPGRSRPHGDPLADRRRRRRQVRQRGPDPRGRPGVAHHVRGRPPAGGHGDPRPGRRSRYRAHRRRPARPFHGGCLSRTAASRRWCGRCARRRRTSSTS